MIREDLVAERVVIEVYSDMIRYFADNDPTTRVMVEGILKDEEEHASDLSDLLFIIDPHTGETEDEDPGTHPLNLDARQTEERSRQSAGGQARQGNGGRQGSGSNAAEQERGRQGAKAAGAGRRAAEKRARVRAAVRKADSRAAVARASRPRAGRSALNPRGGGRNLTKRAGKTVPADPCLARSRDRRTRPEAAAVRLGRIHSSAPRSRRAPMWVNCRRAARVRCASPSPTGRGAWRKQFRR
jgi:Ferritin-like domain